MTIRFKVTKTQEAEYAFYTVKKERLREPRTLAQLKADPRIETYWSEDDEEVKHWAALRSPWRFDQCITIQSSTVKGLLEDLRSTERVNGWTRYCWDTCNEGSFNDYLSTRLPSFKFWFSDFVEYVKQ
jgi:hypothetical protein